MPEPGNPQDLNKYTYGRNNPVKHSDPSGHWVESALDIAGIVWDIYDIKQEGLNWKTGGALALDVACLILPVATGGGAIVRAVTKVDNLGDVKHTAGIVEATVRTVDKANDVTDTLSKFKHAEKFGIGSYNDLRKAVKEAGNVGDKLNVHHLVEKRFAKRLGLEEGAIKSVALTAEEHQKFTKAWRDAIGYVTDSKKLTTGNVGRQQVWEAAQTIYKDFPDLLQATRQTLFGP